jgi:hypothetical protein
MALFWSFFGRRTRAAPAAAPVERFPAVFPDDPAIYVLFRDNDARLKLWLPPSVVQALDRVEQTGELARPRLLRELLFCYVYGAYDLRRMHELGEGLYWQAKDVPLFSLRSADPAVVREAELREQLGKSTVDLLLWLPKRLRDDIAALAEVEGVTPSQFARHVLVAELFGRHYLTGGRRLLVEALRVADQDAETSPVDDDERD